MAGQTPTAIRVTGGPSRTQHRGGMDQGRAERGEGKGAGVTPERGMGKGAAGQGGEDGEHRKRVVDRVPGEKRRLVRIFYQGGAPF